MKKYLPLIFTIFSCIMLNTAHAQVQTSEKANIVRKTTLNYLLWLPEGYAKEKNKTFPLLIFLHGSGERGDSLNLVKKHGPPSFVENRPDFPFITVSPQCPLGVWWNIQDLQAMLEQLIAKYHVDKSRIYLTGLSMGGFGTWAWACAYPKQFAAIAPICGGGDVIFADELKDVPVWAFHGDNDKVVTVMRSRNMISGIKKAGGNPKYTEYPGMGHNCWNVTYNDPATIEWMFSQNRKNKKP